MTNFSQNQSAVNNQNVYQSFSSITTSSARRPGVRLSVPGTSSNTLFIPQTFGSASFMEKNEVIDRGLAHQGKGRKFCPYLGALPPDDIQAAAFIFARSPLSVKNPRDKELPEGNGHLLTIAPTRAGKGTGQIIPNLLTWRGSVLVLDVKGENYAFSAGRRARMEPRIEVRRKKLPVAPCVFRFAPFEEVTDIWNPIMSIRATLNWVESTWKERCQEEEDACYLTELLVTPSGSQHDVFWESQAKIILLGLLLYVRTAELTLNAEDIDNEDIDKPDLQHRVRERSMREVRRLLTLKEEEDFLSLLEDMCESERNRIREAGSILKRFLSGEGKLGQSIMAMLLEQTAVWSFERAHTATYKASTDPDDREPAPNDFTFSQMRDGKTSIYLIIPPEYLSEYRAVLRVMIGCAMRELKNSYQPAKADPKYQNKPPVLFILDEFPQLAYMKPIEEALSYLAGYGVRFWFFVQDISQLKLHYKNWPTFIANTEIKCFYGINDIETAKLVSEMTGTATVPHSSYASGASIGTTMGYQNGYPTGYGENRGDNSSSTLTYTSRPLMTPGEVMRMPNNNQLIFIKGLKPIYCELPKFFEFEDLNKLSKIRPPKAISFF